MIGPTTVATSSPSPISKVRPFCYSKTLNHKFGFSLIKRERERDFGSKIRSTRETLADFTYRMFFERVPVNNISLVSTRILVGFNSV